MRSRHPKKEVEEALQYAELKRWRVQESKGSHTHVWGTLYCPLATRDGCKYRVYGTPRDAGNHANAIRRIVDRCPHTT